MVPAPNVVARTMDLDILIHHVFELDDVPRLEDPEIAPDDFAVELFGDNSR